MSPFPALPRLIGYARVSTEDQKTDAQLDELRRAGCADIRQEHGSGASRERPVLRQLLTTIQSGETLVVVRIDRLARSVSHLLDVIEGLQRRGASFRSLNDPIDTTTPQGMFSLQVLGAVAQLERALISERTRAGIKAAVARGSKPGNPQLRAGRPEAIAKVSAARDRHYLEGVLRDAESWLPTVRRMRPDTAWPDVVRFLNRHGETWTVERLRRATRRLVREGLAEPALLGRAKAQSHSERLMTLVAGIARANPALSLRGIAKQLEGMRERTPRGGSKWPATSVQSLLRQAAKVGLL